MGFSRRGRTRALALLTVALSAPVLAACGSSSEDSSAEAGSPPKTAATAPAAAPASAKYTGIDSTLPSSFPDPVKKAGASFKVGFLQIIGAIPVLAAEQRGVEAEVKALGGSLIVKDAQLDPQKQVAGFDELLAQKVDAIVVYPVVPQALAPQLAKAKAADIPVISTNARPDPRQPLPKGYIADVEQSLDYEAYQLAKALADAAPGSSFAIIGLGAPVSALKYLASRQQHWGKQLGLKYLGEVDSKADQPAAYSAAMTALLGKYPDVENVMTYNDLTALSAATAARSAGKTGIRITGAQGGVKAAVEAIKAGTVFATYAPPWEKTGEQIVKGAYNVVTKQNLPLAETITLNGTIVTKDNAGQFTPVDAG
jgi:ribose transport system substrate-binding protein